MQSYDYRLKPGEKTKLAANGVLAVERMSAESFADIYYRLYSDDMPVFVTADSILHAWHRSFDAFLIDMETQILSPTLDLVLERTILKCHNAISTAHTAESKEVRAILDVELFLTAARSLLQGEKVAGVSENAMKLESLLLLVHAEETTHTYIFSAEREIDFSQFKPRGHYTKSEQLQRYFRAMMWLGTVDFRVAGGEHEDEDLHQLHCAVLLVGFLQNSSSMETMKTMDLLISSLVADGGLGADSLSPNHLEHLLSENKVSACDGKMNSKTLNDLQNQIVQRGLGRQLINGHPRVENLSATTKTPMKLPASFAILGQRFVWSSFIFSRLVFDQVLHGDEKQKRRIPSGVDIAYTLLGNDSAAQILATRMNAKPPRSVGFGAPEFVLFRDGIQFSSNLIALRQTIDQKFDDEGIKSAYPPDTNESISMLWQRALRALSRPSPNSAQTFHSVVWQQRQMNTQLSSFTQLRHDTLLYAKQSYTIRCGCEYAAGMVDPYPLFWLRMHQLAKQMENMIEKNLRPLLEFGSLADSTQFLVSKAQHFFQTFAVTMQTIKDIAICQAEHKALNEAQVDFMKTVMEERFGSGGSKYCGWYPGLFFESREDSAKRDVIVADVHTDSPSTVHRDPGGVLHLGVGDPLMGFFVVDNVIYAGPVFSSYELVTPITERLTDKEFERKLPCMRMPTWAYQSYLA